MTRTPEGIIRQYLEDKKTMTYEEMGAKHGISKQAIWSALKHYHGYKPPVIVYSEAYVARTIGVSYQTLRYWRLAGVVQPARYGVDQWRYTIKQVIALKRHIATNSTCPSCGKTKKMTSRACVTCHRHRWKLVYSDEDKKLEYARVLKWKRDHPERVAAYNAKRKRKVGVHEAILRSWVKYNL